MILNMLDLTNNCFYEWLLSRLFITLFSIVTAWGNNEMLLHNLFSASQVFPGRNDHEKCEVFEIMLYAGSRKAL